MQHATVTKLGDQHYKGSCPICSEEADFREQRITFGMLMRTICVLVARPWSTLHSAGAANAIAQNVSCSACKTYVEVCPLCLAAWRGTISADGVKCPGCGAQLI